MGCVKQDSSRSLCCLCPTDRRRTSADIVTEIQPLIRTITFSSRYLINISCPHSELKGHTCICAGLLSAASGSAFIPVVSITEHSDPFGWVCTLLSRGVEMEKQARLRIYGRSQLMSHRDSLLLTEKHPTYLDEMSVCVSLRPRQAMETLALTTSSLEVQPR
ncbi:hypothetical protein CHARACLAT_032256 [Characodon lateralis]|uniref:Uncharacterized protein n=1 Tax=Characodon lateralis TaxID=208331 RepID=A0ABU7CT77_9TELE|nr:hypothetical protein [Characodon lateralis]